jgi:hypothetical protein
MANDTCSRCGAKVYAGAAWCGQCFAPVAEPEPASPSELAPPPASPLASRMPVPKEPAHVPTFSRWRGGPTSFGPAGRTVLSVLAVLLGVVGYPMSRGLILASVGFDVPGHGYLMMYAVIAAAAEVYLFSRIWKRERIA